jgi:hypothetical protein
MPHAVVASTFMFREYVPMSRGHRSKGGTNRHFIHVGPLPETDVSPPL